MHGPFTNTVNTKVSSNAIIANIKANISREVALTKKCQTDGYQQGRLDGGALPHKCLLIRFST